MHSTCLSLQLITRKTQTILSAFISPITSAPSRDQRRVTSAHATNLMQIHREVATETGLSSARIFASASETCLSLIGGSTTLQQHAISRSQIGKWFRKTERERKKEEGDTDLSTRTGDSSCHLSYDLDNCRYITTIKKEKKKEKAMIHSCHLKAARTSYVGKGETYSRKIPKSRPTSRRKTTKATSSSLNRNAQTDVTG